MGERRKSKRFLQKSRATINCYVRHNSFVYEEKHASIRELSIEGVRLAAYYELPAETDCKISLDLEGSNQMVQAWARVVWSEKTRRKGEYEIGIVFLHTEETRAQLIKHLFGEDPQPS